MRFSASRVSASNAYILSSIALSGIVLTAAVILPGYAGSNVEVMDAHGTPLKIQRDSQQRINRLENSLSANGTMFPATSPASKKPNTAAVKTTVNKTKTVSAPKSKPVTTEASATASMGNSAQTTETSATAPNAKPVANPRTISNAKMAELNPALASLTNIEKDAIRHLDRATQLGTKGQLKAAFLEYESALRINPKLADAYVGKAAVYGYQGEWEKAVSSLQTALNLDTEFITPANRINAQFNLSSCYCFQNNAQAAWENYRQNLEGKHPRANALVSFMNKTCPENQSTSAASQQP